MRGVHGEDMLMAASNLLEFFFGGLRVHIAQLCQSQKPCKHERIQGWSSAVQQARTDPSRISGFVAHLVAQGGGHCCCKPAEQSADHPSRNRFKAFFLASDSQ